MIRSEEGARVVTGRIKVHPDGFGFVVPDDKTEDIHVSARARGSAMDGDRVEVVWWVGPRGLEGRVVDVVERGRGKITGVIEKVGKLWRLSPDDPRITGPVILRGGPGGAQPGEVVVAEIAKYAPDADSAMEVNVLKVLGDPDDIGTEIEKILAIADINEEFPGPVAHAAEHVPQEVRQGDLRDRVDLRRIPFVTIDPETARDFDDAVAVDSLRDGWRLWVAVADVSHYLHDGSEMDEEAQKRGCSVYLPNRAIPMLPEQLSSHICSLIPEEDRLAMVVRIEFDAKGSVVDTDFAAAVIHSRARLDYPGVAAALSGDTRGKRKKYDAHLPALEVMADLAKVLRARRRERGALDLDLPEAVIELDRDDPKLVRDVRRARRDPREREAYAMIEEFMLAANEAVAESFARRGEPTVWRIHDVPAEEKLELFGALAESYGMRVDPEEARSPKGLSRILQSLKGHPAEKALSFQLLRSLKQATYDVVNVGHYGLASRAYLHFTSPIRRYPDVIAHRLLKQRLATLGKPAGGFPPMGEESPGEHEIQRMAADSSFAERKAMEVEREVKDLYRAYFMRDRVGDVLDGTISGVTAFGLFVLVDEPFVEGLVRIDQLGDDYFQLDDTGSRLVGSRTGASFSLGDTVSIEVLSVSVARRKLDFRLVAHQARTIYHGRDGERRGGRRGRRDGADEREAPRRGAKGGRKERPPEREGRDGRRHKEERQLKEGRPTAEGSLKPGRRKESAGAAGAPKTRSTRLGKSAGRRTERRRGPR